MSSKKAPDNRGDKSNFDTVAYGDLPSGRRGKHHSLILQVLQDLDSLEEGRAIKIPLAEFTGTVADLRSAISRATRKTSVDIATSSDEQYLYVWKPLPGTAIE
jgi:hypothetical protein